jgi:ATP-binding cassette subfamily C (CFTR/MRP) protein 1
MIFKALLVIALISSCTSLVFVFMLHIPVAILLPYVLEVLALAASIPLTYLTHERSRTSSSILLLFWPAYTVAFLIRARTLFSTLNSPELLPVLIPKCAVVVLGLASFGLECLGPEHIDPFGHENPIVTANIFSRWTFGWMTPLMKKGATEYITEDDLPSLLSQNESAKLGNDLKKALDKRCVRSPSHCVYRLIRYKVNGMGRSTFGGLCSWRTARPTFWLLV